jgi:hypothetical protein
MNVKFNCPPKNLLRSEKLYPNPYLCGCATVHCGRVDIWKLDNIEGFGGLMHFFPFLPPNSRPVLDLRRHFVKGRESRGRIQIY